MLCKWCCQKFCVTLECKHCSFNFCTDCISWSKHYCKPRDSIEFQYRKKIKIT